MDKQLKDQTRTIVRGVYDIQKLRIQTGNRIVGNFKAKLGLAPSESEEELDIEGKKILQDLRRDYRRISSGVIELPSAKKFKASGLISTYTEFCLVSEFMALEEFEEMHFKQLSGVLEAWPIYTEWLKHVKGVGPAMGGVLVSEIDIAAAKYPSSLWKYAGLDVVINKEGQGEGRSRRADHLVDVAYIAKDGTEKTKKSLVGNPFLKSKLMGPLASSFIRTASSPYRTCYDNYRFRIDNMEAHAEKTKKHRYNMAIRYMIKMFLRDLYLAWRPLEGLPVAPDYSEGKLGHVHEGRAA